MVLNYTTILLLHNYIVLGAQDSERATPCPSEGAVLHQYTQDSTVYLKYSFIKDLSPVNDTAPTPSSTSTNPADINPSEPNPKFIEEPT